MRAYPDSPRITMASMVISPTRVMTQAVPTSPDGDLGQVMDLLHDSLRVIAYPGQVKSAEPTYRLTRGMNEAFLEKSVGEQLTSPPAPPLAGEGSGVGSAAGVLQAATAQGIPLMYVDAQRLELLASLPISEQVKARIVQATQQGYGVLVPEQMVTWSGQQVGLFLEHGRGPGAQRRQDPAADLPGGFEEYQSISVNLSTVRQAHRAQVDTNN